MKPIVIFLFVATAIDISSSSAVIELADSDFDRRITEYDTALVMFYAPWCGHCKKLKPEFDLASTQLVKNDPPVQLLKVDCTEGGKKTCESFGVQRYPTLKIFKNGKSLSKEYSGPIEGLGIAKYMARQAGPSFVHLSNREDYDNFLSSEDNEDLDNRIVGFFRDSSPLKRSFLQAADFLRDDFRFAVTSLPILLKENDDKDGVVMFRPKQLQNTFEPSQLKYTGRPATSAIESWLKTNKHGLVDPRTRENHEEFENPLVVAYYNVDYANNAKSTNYWRNRILKVAQDFASDFTFAISSKDQNRHEIEIEFGQKYTTSDKPIVLARNEDKKKFVMSEEFSVESFESFLRKLKNNELEPYFKSEPIPKDNSKPVKVAVGKNFDDVVMKNSKDTLIEFYAPWCGHCKKLTPIWDELGEKMANENVAIVKMDATANDVPSPFKTEGYPTIYWAPKNGKSSPVKYTGERELNNFISYIAKHATYELKSYDRNGKARAKDKPSTREVVSSDVIELMDSDFKSRITEYELALVMFYAPWCGHCKQLKPEFDLASTELKKNDPPIQLLKVDCTKGGKKTCNSFSVESYPTLKIFRNGVVSQDYNGPRDRPGIVKYMVRQSGPSATELNSKEAYEKFLSGEDNAVVGFFNKDSSTLKKAFLQTADTFREKFSFGITSLPVLLAENDDKDGVILFRPKIMHNIFEPSQLKYSGRGTKSAMASWLKENHHGLVDPRTRDNSDEFENPLVVAYYDVDYAKNAKATNYWRNRILKVATDFASDFTFAISPINDFEDELEEEFGYKSTSSEKPVVYAHDENKKKFVMSEEFSAENFESFLRKLKNNELEPYLKSEPVPEDNSKPVKVAVAKNFDDVVINNDKDTLIEFYAPWCGHCKKLTPIWDKLGEKMAEEDVAIVKMDATANDVPSPFEVRGFPSIYWAPKNGKSSPVKYAGERELKDFIKYIAKHATYELKNYDKNGKLIKKKDEL